MTRARIFFIASFFLATTAAAQEICPDIFAKIVSREIVMDISRTEQAVSFVARPRSKAEILSLIEIAKEKKLSLTMRGTNHSHGGHNRRADIRGTPRGIQIDMQHFNKVLSLDIERQTVTVQPGITWRDLSVFLNEHGLSAKTEQSSNIFSVGGSVSTNIHGRDVYGPLIQSVVELKVIGSDGVERVLNRASNPELFRAAVGGYGGLGVLTEVTLRVGKNTLLEAGAVKNVSLLEYEKYLNDLPNKTPDLMHYGRINITGADRFSRVSYVQWTPIDSARKPRDWNGWKLNLGESNRWLSSMVMNSMRYSPTSKVGKKVKDFLDSLFGLPTSGTVKTKNNILNNPVNFLFDNFYNSKESVDILQEYFVPVDKMRDFFHSLSRVIDKHDLNLLNATMRYVPKIEKAQDSLLSPYSGDHDLVAIVLYFNIHETKGLKNGMLVQYDGAKWTQELIQDVQAMGGSFYWPYHRWWSNEQITNKEHLREYFKLKEQTDPSGIYESDFLFHLRKALD